MNSLPYHSKLYFSEEKRSLNPELDCFLKSSELKEFLESLGTQVILTLWGDGTMLAAIHHFKEENIPFLWINFGTKGFLMNAQDALKSREFIPVNCPLLRIEIQTSEKQQVFYALNEVNIDSSGGRVLELDINISQKSSISLAGDGILIATPMGSTAYNRSLGWPIIPHSIPAFVLTPKAPWKPQRQSPIILSQEEVIHLKNSWRSNAFNIYADGIELLKEYTGKVDVNIQKAQRVITLLIAKEQQEDWDLRALREQWFHKL